MNRIASATVGAVVLSFAVACAADVVINEVLYDPDGSDTGLEFVEVMNCGHATVPLADWILETGNGAGPDDWTVEWIGGPLDELAPGGILVIGERDVMPPPDVVTALDLQNGPDACRLTDGSRVVDVVGWGEPLFSEYCEGTPAEDVSSGLSLARLPDCLDVDDNQLDFAGRVPTPGSKNTVTFDVALRVDHASRHVFPEGEAVVVNAVLSNVGAEGVAPGCVEVVVACGGEDVASVLSEGELAPRDSSRIAVPWVAPAGYHAITVACRVLDDGDPSNNIAATTVAVGRPAGCLVLNEAMHSPGDSTTEWLEFVSTTHGTLDVSGWSVGDDDDEHVLEFDGGDNDDTDGRPARVAPGEFLLVAREPALLNVPGAPAAGTDGWEALSRDDVVVLLDSFGTPIDRVQYVSDWGGGRDVSLERVRPDLAGDQAASWGSSVDASGSTPGRANSIAIEHLPAGGTLTVKPNPFSPDGDGRDDRTAVAFELPTATAQARLSVYDMRGRLRGRLLDRVQVASRHHLVWDGCLDGARLPPGLYILHLEAIDARTGVLTSEHTAVGIAR